MKAIRYHTYGGPDVLRLEQVTVPKAAEGEVVVRVHAAGVNPGDWQIRSGLAGDRFELPYTPGWDISGVVASVGEGVTGLKQGDAVYGMTANSGGCAEYVAVPAGHLALKPRSADFVQAAALPQSGFTAWHALFIQGKLEAGHTVLINGAAGGVGHLAVQLARWKGAAVIGAASARNKTFLDRLGVDRFVDYTAVLPPDMVRIADLVLDTAGGDQGSWLLDTLKPGGRLVPIAWGSYSSEQAEKASVIVQQVQYPPIAPVYLQELSQLVDSGQLNVEIDSIFPLEETANAHLKSESRRTRGKIVISII
ncbi:NADP-dependent oxidoreductase [Paenibacillus protaetiae]|uniref:NADP-dependent oxidoreductase n=2 Tax=Paenibacillus protaetiae TaxID=2509456 RepID=A0A4P6F057_9BACL|nr:NADP-dependent oxidoreductase [Paenibacillus protaetiae]